MINDFEKICMSKNNMGKREALKHESFLHVYFYAMASTFCLWEKNHTPNC